MLLILFTYLIRWLIILGTSACNISICISQTKTFKLSGRPLIPRQKQTDPIKFPQTDPPFNTAKKNTLYLYRMSLWSIIHMTCLHQTCCPKAQFSHFCMATVNKPSFPTQKQMTAIYKTLVVAKHSTHDLHTPCIIGRSVITTNILSHQ